MDVRLVVDRDVTVEADAVTVVVIGLVTKAVEILLTTDVEMLVTVLVASGTAVLVEREVEEPLVVVCPGPVPERSRLIRTATNRIEAMATDAARKGPDLAEPFLALPILVKRSHPNVRPGRGLKETGVARVVQEEPR